MLLITSPPGTDKSAKIVADAAKALEWDVYSPSNDCWSIPCELYGKETAIFGDELFAKFIADRLGITLLDNPSNWIAKLPRKYTGRNIEVMFLDEAREIKEEKFFKSLSYAFTSKIGKGSDLPENPVLNKRKVLVSDPIKISARYRVFVADNQPVSVCCYEYNGYFNSSVYSYRDNDTVIELALSLFQDRDVISVPSIAIDIGRIETRPYHYEYVVLNSYPAWSSALFDCEKAGSLHAIKTSCKKVSNVNAQSN